MKKNKITNIISALVFLAGLSLLLYPGLSDRWNRTRASQAIAGYTRQVADLNEKKYQQMYLETVAYNTARTNQAIGTALDREEQTAYQSVLNVTGTGMMGYIEIEKLWVNLPIYHGTDETALQMGAGHVEWSSLPVGGESTHCVLSGHRGLPSAKLFSDLDQLEEGDRFTLHVLNEVLSYEVDQIRIVKPEVTKDLKIEKGKDYCTLVTCTPYGVNTHRLLVRGHRVETEKKAGVMSEAMVVEPLLVAPFLAVPLLLVLVISIWRKPRRGRKKSLPE